MMVNLRKKAIKLSEDIDGLDKTVHLSSPDLANERSYRTVKIRLTVRSQSGIIFTHTQ